MNPEDIESEVNEAKNSGHHSLYICEQALRNKDVFNSFSEFRGYFPNAALVEGAEESSPQFTALMKIYHPSTMDSSWLRLISRQETFQLHLLAHDQYTDLGKRVLKDMSLLLRAAH